MLRRRAVADIRSIEDDETHRGGSANSRRHAHGASPPRNIHTALSKAQVMSKAQQLTAGPSPIEIISYSGLALGTADGGALGGLLPSMPDVRGEPA